MLSTIMEPLAAVSLVGTVVQLVQYATELASKTAEVRRSCDGVLTENETVETITKDLAELNEGLKMATAGTSPRLAALCASCGELADELLARLKGPSASPPGKRKSIRLALRSMWTKEEINGIERRLAGFRDEINLHIVVEIR